MLKSGILSAVLLLVASGAFAGSLGAYGGIQYSVIEDDENVELGVAGARVGGFISDNFSVELRAGVGVRDHTEYDGLLATKITVEADQLLGVYFRGGIPLTPAIYPYVIAGYSQLDYTVSADGFGSESEEEGGSSLGFGLELFMGKSLGLTLEAMRLLDEKDVELDSISLSVLARF